MPQVKKGRQKVHTLENTSLLNQSVSIISLWADDVTLLPVSVSRLPRCTAPSPGSPPGCPAPPPATPVPELGTRDNYSRAFALSNQNRRARPLKIGE